MFQRTECKISVVVHMAGTFFYGEVVDLSLGGAKLILRKPLEAPKVELAPNRSLTDGFTVIPLPYDVCWQDVSAKTLAGLQFTGGTNDFFRGWLASHLKPLMGDFTSLLDHRKQVRLPCQLVGRAVDDEGEFACSILDISLGGVSFITQREMLPGMSLTLEIADALSPPVEIILLRVQPLTEHYLCGGKFLEPDQRAQSQLDKLVADLVSAHRTATIEP